MNAASRDKAPEPSTAAPGSVNPETMARERAETDHRGKMEELAGRIARRQSEAQALAQRVQDLREQSRRRAQELERRFEELHAARKDSRRPPDRPSPPPVVPQEESIPQISSDDQPVPT